MEKDTKKEKAATPELSSSSLKEDGHFFDFVPFYKQPQFCDRTIRLEILDDSPSGNRGGAEASRPARENTAKGNDKAEGLDGGEIDPGNAADESTETHCSQEELPATEEGRVSGRKRAREEGDEPGRDTRSELAGEDAGSASERLDEKSKGAQAADGSDKGLVSNVAGRTGEAEKSGDEIDAGLQRAENPEVAEERSKQEAASSSGAVDKDGPESSRGAEGPEEIPISSIVVAAKSRVLRAMLSSDMREGQKDAAIVVKVTRQEKRAFKEMIDFFYNGTLSKRLLDEDSSTPELIATLLLGDKFEAHSFMGAVLDVLQDKVEDGEDADLETIALHIPELLHQRTEVRELVESAGEALVASFRNVSNWRVSFRFYALGESAIEFLLRSEELEGGDEVDVLDGAQIWVQQQFDAPEERAEAFRRLAPFVRFGCIKGEVLERLFDSPEMQSPEVQKLLQKALVYQAYSDPKKLTSISEFSRVREGFRKDTIELFFNFVLGERGFKVLSPWTEWNGRKWSLAIEKVQTRVPPTLGINLVRGPKSGSQSNEADIIQTQFFAKSWPSGYWSLLKSGVWTYAKEETEGKGSCNIFKKSWQELKASEFVGCTNEIIFRVVAKRLIEDSDSE
ncbi:hypothetical protein KFL_004180140 [Klebsormidium nitens]|uniref:BTB domain-containing protein n=1 Tax=Klebsormidium nitens TaxID=105231 RepID=A0A1Y1IJL4_KLENI|nr:hypothetical protein KFL_004180140 [Klebsormidium nitens]|eukprot:GAQ88328.1 hypothetical protein KFL_004180140 [Klebsormidium nitens]